MSHKSDTKAKHGKLEKLGEVGYGRWCGVRAAGGGVEEMGDQECTKAKIKVATMSRSRSHQGQSHPITLTTYHTPSHYFPHHTKLFLGGGFQVFQV